MTFMTQNNMKLTTLYSRTSTGAVQQWTIEIEGDCYRTHHGQVDGKIQTTEWTTCKPKNEGKVNATTAEEQALKESQALWKKQTETGYFEDIDNIDNLAWQEPMRANEYQKVKAKDKKNKLAYPLYVQPKLDGHRCVVNKDGAWTRKGKRYASIPHIEKALEPLFKEFPDLVLDGELYADKFANDFNELSSIVRKSKPEAEDLLKSEETMQYWIYDIADTTQRFFERSTRLCDMLGKFNKECIVFVPTYKINSDEELVQKYEEFIDKGFEGMMVRTNTPYEFKRTDALLKYKEFQDAEFTAVECVEGEGNRKGTLACIWFVNEDGHRFKGDMTGSRDYNRDLWSKCEKIPGTRWTVKFFNRTPDKNIPRFPKVKAQRFD
jgi:DNA ligase-1